jgi:hypothetical protein
MPFVSQQQRKYFYAKLPHLAKKWEDHTPKGKKLPKYKKEEGGFTQLQKGGIAKKVNPQDIKPSDTSSTGVVKPYVEVYPENMVYPPVTVTGHSDKGTREFFDNVRKEDEDAYQALTEIGRHHGFAKVSYKDKGSVGHYNPLTNTSTLHKVNSERPYTVGDYPSTNIYEPNGYAKTYLEELAHKIQFDKNPAGSAFKWATNDLIDYTKRLYTKPKIKKLYQEGYENPDVAINNDEMTRLRRSSDPYLDKDALEYEAHSIISPKLIEEFVSNYGNSINASLKLDEVLNKKQKGGLSATGYLPTSKDKNRPYNVIPSPDITMKTVPHPVLGISQETGEEKMMMPGEEHHFENTQNVLEIPMFQKLNKKQAGGRLVTQVPEGYNFLKEDGGKKYYNKKSATALAMAQASGQARGGAQYEQFLQTQLGNGVSPDELVAKKYIDGSAVGKYQQYYKPIEDTVYTEQAPLPKVDVSAKARRGEPAYDVNRHIAAEIFYDSRDSKNTPDGGTLNTANQNARFKFRNDFGYTGEEVEVPANDVQKYLGIGNSFTSNDTYKQLLSKASKPAIAQKKHGGLVRVMQLGGVNTVQPYDRDVNNVQAPNLTGLKPMTLIQPQPMKRREDNDLSFLPAVANSVAEALATRVDMQRKDNYIQSNLANPFNYIPETNNTNKYVNYGTPQFQEGGETGGDDYEDMQDEDFLYQDETAADTEPAEQTEAPVENQVPDTSEDDQIVQDDEPIDLGESDDSEESTLTAPVVSDRLKSIVLNQNTGGLDNEIAAVESGGDYRAQNPNSSAVGKYQFLWNQWKGDIAKATGITSKEQFRNNPEAQEKFYSQYKQNVLLPSAASLQKYNSKGLNFNQLAKLVHFKGVGGAKKYLTSGVDDTRANNISIPKYIGK